MYKSKISARYRQPVLLRILPLLVVPICVKRVHGTAVLTGATEGPTPLLYLVRSYPIFAWTRMTASPLFSLWGAFSLEAAAAGAAAGAATAAGLKPRKGYGSHQEAGEERLGRYHPKYTFYCDNSRTPGGSVDQILSGHIAIFRPIVCDTTQGADLVRCVGCWPFPVLDTISHFSIASPWRCCPWAFMAVPWAFMAPPRNTDTELPPAVEVPPATKKRHGEDMTRATAHDMAQLLHATRIIYRGTATGLRLRIGLELGLECEHHSTAVVVPWPYHGTSHGNATGKIFTAMPWKFSWHAMQSVPSKTMAMP